MHWKQQQSTNQHEIWDEMRKHLTLCLIQIEFVALWAVVDSGGGSWRRLWIWKCVYFEYIAKSWQSLLRKNLTLVKLEKNLASTLKMKNFDSGKIKKLNQTSTPKTLILSENEEEESEVEEKEVEEEKKYSSKPSGTSCAVRQSDLTHYLCRWIFAQPH